MRKTILSGVLALVLLPIAALASPTPNKFDRLHTRLDHGSYVEPTSSCNTGGTGVIIMGAVVGGLLVRRRR